MLLFSINRSRGYENPSLDIIVIELYSIGGYPLEEAREHCFQIQGVISVVILISFQCYCGECSGYIVVILPLLAFYFSSTYILYLVYYKWYHSTFLILMAHTRSQDLEARFNTLQSSLIETQQEVKQLGANVDTINTTMQSLMGEIKQDLTTQLESVFSVVCTKLHIPTDNPSSSSPPHTEGDHSSHSHTLHNHHFQRELRLPRVDVTKCDRSDPTG
jgi:hypothetical protein